MTIADIKSTIETLVSKAEFTAEYSDTCQILVEIGDHPPFVMQEKLDYEYKPSGEWEINEESGALDVVRGIILSYFKGREPFFLLGKYKEVFFELTTGHFEKLLVKKCPISVKQATEHFN